jgi:hypothetical protein
MITLTITGADALEVMSTLRGCNDLIVAGVKAAPPKDEPKAETTTQQAPVIPTSAPASMPPVGQMAPAPVAPPTPPISNFNAPPAAPVPVAAPSYTLDQVTRAGADLITARPDLMGSLMALLPKYGVQTLAALQPEQLGPVATELRALGAKI